MQLEPDGGMVLAPDDTSAVFEIYIKTSPERLWEALTDPEQRAKYFFGWATESDWAEGSEYRWTASGVGDVAAGENLEVDPPRRLVQSFNAAVQRRSQVRGHDAGDLGDRACRRRLVPPHRRPRSAEAGGEQRDLRRLAAGPLGSEDAAGDGRGADDARVAATGAG